jgi:hypothetical protein
MERVVATYRVGAHEVDVVETLEDESSWFHLVVDGLAGSEVLDRPPGRKDVERLVAGVTPRQGPPGRRPRSPRG